MFYCKIRACKTPYSSAASIECLASNFQPMAMGRPGMYIPNAVDGSGVLKCDLSVKIVVSDILCHADIEIPDFLLYYYFFITKLY